MRLGIKTSTKPVKKTFEQIVGVIANSVQNIAEMRKAGGHKYVKREGSPGHYKYWYRLPNGRLGSKADLNEATRSKQGTDQVGKKKTANKKRLGIRKPPQGNEVGEFKRGDKISGVDVNGEKVSGTVTAVGADGVTVDGQFHVEHGKAKKEGKQSDGSYIPTKDDKKEVLRRQKLQPYEEKYKRAEQLASFAEKNKATDAAELRQKADEYKKEFEQMKNGKGKKETKPPQRTYLSPDKFNANDYAKQWADTKATPDEAGFNYILDSFGKEGADIAEKIRETEEKLKFGSEDRDTQNKFLIRGKGESARYKEVREKLHGAIMQTLLAPDKIRMAKPDPNSEPTFTILGGRGGSGKSWFKGKVYDPAKCVVLDADEIKAMLPEYQGWNAQDVHEESSDILEQMIGMCIREGLNVTLDATMKTADSAIGKILRFKSAGYRVEAHYMHLPVQEAAKRAIGRFKCENGDYTGRYVPVDKILKNTTNEDSFDQVRRMADKWSFRDSNGKKGEQPILISEGKKEVKKSFSEL
jgi:predicted ABC-type ATPase